MDDLGRGRFKIYCDDQELEDTYLQQEESRIRIRQEFPAIHRMKKAAKKARYRRHD